MLIEQRRRVYDGLTCVWARKDEGEPWRLIRVFDAEFEGDMRAMRKAHVRTEADG